MKKLFLVSAVITMICGFSIGNASMNLNQESDQKRGSKIKRELNDQISWSNPKKVKIEAADTASGVQSEEEQKAHQIVFPLFDNAVSFSSDKGEVSRMTSSIKEEYDSDNISYYFSSSSSSSTNSNDFSLEGLLKRAKNRLRRNRFKQSIKDLDQVLAVSGINNITKADALSYRGYAKYNFGQYQAAITNLDQALSIFGITDLMKADAVSCRGYAKYNLGQYEAAIVDLDQVLEMSEIADVMKADVLNYRGYAKYNLGQYEAAVIDLDQALAIPKIDNVTKASTLSCRGYAQYNLNQYRAAINNLEESLKFKNVFSNQQLSQTYEKLSLLYRNI